MLVSCRSTRIVLEAGEALGIPRQEIVASLGLDPRKLSDPRQKVDWADFVAVVERLGEVLGGDVERLRSIGRSTVRVPGNALLRQLARVAVSPRRLYELGVRWLGPADFAHLPLSMTILSERRLRIRAGIPESYAPSESFLRITEGMLAELPVLCGRPPAAIVESRVSSRSLDLILDLPRSTTLLGRIRHALNASETIELLEAQRGALAEGIEALRYAREESRALLERLPDLIIIHAAGSILWVNRAAVVTLGYEQAGDLVGQSILAMVAPASRSLVEARMREPPEVLSEPVEVHFLTRSGGTVAVEVSPVQAVRFAGAQARLVVGRDVTERLRMQLRLATADRLASLGLLAAGVAHEVNNPLGYVLGNIELARKDLASLGEATARSREALGVALEGVARIRAIVHDLLMLSRGTDGKAMPVDVSTVVDSTLTLARAEIEKTARLVRNYALPGPSVRASVPRLTQVLVNLLANALDAMRERPPEQNELVVRVETRQDGVVAVEVSDNGEGIAPEHVGRVFEPFFTTKAEGKGTGLGLSISQRLVLELGGEIEVASTPGEGTTLRLLLPAADAPADPDQAPS